jgi:hypothetical protein
MSRSMANASRGGSVAWRTALIVAVAVAALLASVSGARAAGGTGVGGAVSSTLALSLGEPSQFVRVHAGGGQRVYDATIVAEVTATDAPTRLSLADGEVTAGKRRGRLVRGTGEALAIPLRAAAGHGSYRSLDARVDPVLEEWRESVSLESAVIRLRQVVRARHPRSLAGYEKLLLVTVTGAGP